VPRNKMTCREFVGLIGAYRDGELSGADSQSFSQHGGDCARCSGYLKGYEQTVRAARRSGEDSRDGSETRMPEPLVREIIGRTRTQRIRW
jgi:anti-sigma factor RsiW